MPPDCESADRPCVEFPPSHLGQWTHLGDFMGIAAIGKPIEMLTIELMAALLRNSCR
jgi:hypothetical protein